MNHFPASYDLTTKLVTSIAILTLLVIVTVVHIVFVGCLLLLIPLLGFAYSPRGYVVSNRRITVKRLAGNVDVPLDGVRAARRITKDDLRGGIRLWGSGGLFGYYGLFSTTSLGKCTWYVTNRKNAIVVITESKTTLFSPDDVDAFLAAVHSILR